LLTKVKTEKGEREKQENLSEEEKSVFVGVEGSEEI